jgi:uncharacterized protein
VSSRLVEALVWARLDEAGLERCRLWADPDGGWTLDGVAVVLWEGVGHTATYRVVCDGSFATRTADVSVSWRDRERNVRLSSEGGRWRADQALPDVDGCVDVDIGFTPSTNTLPVRRLALEVGQSADVDAAWVRFPDLTVERLRQRYTRLAGRRYRYQSLDGGFIADLDVDDDGLVVTYEGIWERIGGVSV